MTTAITNRDRADHCAVALRNYHDDDWDIKTSLVDFLADARHWCDCQGETYAELDQIAYQHYLAEIGEEGGVAK